MPIDKRLHFIVGFFSFIFFSFFLTLPQSLLAVVLIAIAKELRDKISGKGTPEVMDAVATVVGGICGRVLIEVIKCLQ